MAKELSKNSKLESKSKSRKRKTSYSNLIAEYPNLWENRSEDDFVHTHEFAEEYKAFIDSSKTEREFVINAIEAAVSLGYQDIEQVKTLVPGQKVYQSIKGKGLMLAVIGKEDISSGMHILGAHIDSPRLDLKPNPIYEDSDLCFFKTHYYGGIKKYQWMTIPLAIHGVIVRKDGSTVSICIGENDDDPIFYITDLLPHLGQEQMKKTASEFVKGEDLQLLIGGKPMKDCDDSDAVKLNILSLLNEEYGITEKDFVSAELEVVPAFKSRDVGFDRAFIAGYGHDDKVCAYPALMSIFAQESPKHTVICMLSDKEEIGSYGNSGAQSRLYENFLVEVFVKVNGFYDELLYRKTIANTKMLSADVSNAYDPKFASVSDRNNTAYLSKGIKMEKYTGSRGKSGASDANSEFFAKIIRVFQENNIPWQTGELGKVDAGGGGTISAYLAKLGMEVIDCGVPVLSMHAPYEVVSKIDLYFTYLAYKAFIENMD